MNISRVTPLGSPVLKAATFFLSFFLIHYFLVSIVRSKRTVETLTKFLVSGTAVVAGFSVIEQRTGFNIFDHVGRVLPMLQFNGLIEADRAGLVRAVGSSAHPIELGVLLAMAFPLGLALVFGSGRRWWIPTAMLVVGAMSSVSRTPILVLLTAGLVLLCLRPRDMKRLCRWSCRSSSLSSLRCLDRSQR